MVRDEDAVDQTKFMGLTVNEMSGKGVFEVNDVFQIVFKLKGDVTNTKLFGWATINSWCVVNR